MSDDESAVYGLLILNNDPKNINLDDGCHDWENWIEQDYDISMNVITKDLVKFANSLFLTLFICDGGYSHQTLDSILTFVFDWLPHLQNIGYLVNETHLIEPPLADLKLNKTDNETNNRIKKSDGQNIKFFNQAKAKKDSKFRLWICSRADFTKTFRIRKSRVEDCDDIAPMLIKQNDVILRLIKIDIFKEKIRIFFGSTFRKPYRKYENTRCRE